ILADWLEDHSRGPADEARVRAIRAGVEAGRLPEGDERRDSLEDEARKMFVKHEDEGLGAPVAFCGPWYSALERGVVAGTGPGGRGPRPGHPGRRRGGPAARGGRTPRLAGGRGPQTVRQTRR